jgi:hypothetical protein
MTNKPTLNGILLGAGLMYLLDPDKGRRRRSVLRDRFSHSLRELGGGLDTSVRDLRHRGYGVLAETRSRFRSAKADDTVIEARVRSRIGRIVSHPGSIRVLCEDGIVTLGGPILADEVDTLHSTVRSVPGVRGVVDQLEVHRSSTDVPGLQGLGHRPGELPDVLQQNWAPATRLLMTVTGGILTMYGLRQRGVVRHGVPAVLADFHRNGSLLASVCTGAMLLAAQPSAARQEEHVGGVGGLEPPGHVDPQPVRRAQR